IIGTIMIVLDRPFKLGDYINLADGERGEVAEVGLRSTRIRTRDDILISIPNSVIANAKMINESAPISMSRIRIKVGVAYGSDLKRVEEILLTIAEQNETVSPENSISALR
ncbi:MAG: mechanosensitive ion channel, partial [Candidatus Marsarchaeota archaeon]|nr:mechanosensitive ion channel [Candidatus Marsarchaeota archaeon]